MEQAPTTPALRMPRYAPPDVVWYFGAAVAAAAGVALIGSTSTAERGVWILLVGLATMAAFGLVAALFLRAGLPIPGGVVAAALVWLVPPTEVGFERLFGVHPRLPLPSSRTDLAAAGGGFHGALFSIAMGTVVVGLGVYWLVRFAFVLLPVAVALALAALVFMPAVVSRPGAGDYVVTGLLTGIVFCVAGLLLDARLHRREAFWWYAVGLFGVAVAFAYYLARHVTWVWLVLLAVAALVLLASAPLGRAVWTSYALVGVYAAVAHYVDVATGSWRTTLVLTAVGLLLVALGAALDAADAGLVARLTRAWTPWRAQPPP